MITRFRDRTDAGLALAERFAGLSGEDCIVLALPRGGLPVAAEVARALHAPLDILNVRKLGVPFQPELAMGAVSTGGVRVLNDEVISSANISKDQVELATSRERMEIERREQLYRGGRPAPEIAGRTAIIVDDGIATGATVRAAIAVVRAQKPRRIVLGVPVAAASTVKELSADVDQIICVIAPEDMFAIGLWYDQFPQLTDADVRAFLTGVSSSRDSSAAGAASPAPPAEAPARP
jgi:putative phosphoribosyl transferase